MHPTRRGRPGFTLIELLIAVGIIVILIGLILPALGRTRETGRRVVCASNLRQVHASYAAYAADNSGLVPLGYRSGRKQFNSMVYSTTTKKYCLFGILYLDKRMTDPQVFFCPSEEDPQSMFNSETNPWPPGPPANAGKNGYAGYGCRPEVDLPDEFHKIDGVRVPRLSQFKDKAIFADLVAMPDRLDYRHRQGVNVLYGDGSVGWVKREAFEDSLNACTAISPAANPHQDKIWAALDKG